MTNNVAKTTYLIYKIFPINIHIIIFEHILFDQFIIIFRLKLFLF